MNQPYLLWEPSESFTMNSNLQRYLEWLHEHKGLIFNDYHTLWQWSVESLPAFWESIWEYFEVIAHSPYLQVLTDGKMPGARWFQGSSLNYA